jgi:hypothetical protein
MRPRRLVSALICGVLLATAWPLEPPPARSDDLSPELVDTLKSIPVPHTKAFIRYHGELVEHNIELAPRCFECHQNKQQFCVGCHAVVYAGEETGESGETESEDWERHDIGRHDGPEEISLFERLGIPLDRTGTNAD